MSATIVGYARFIEIQQRRSRPHTELLQPTFSGVGGETLPQASSMDEPGAARAEQQQAILPQSDRHEWKPA